MKTIKGLFGAILLSTLSIQFCAAKVPVEKVQAEILKAQIFPSDVKVACRISGFELTATAYKSDTAAEKDCKIYAMLLAKTAFQCDSELTRATLQLFDIRNPNTYYEVSVTVGDVAAFGGGAVSQEKLLSSLHLVPRTLEPSGTAATSGTIAVVPGAQTNSPSSKPTNTQPAEANSLENTNAGKAPDSSADTKGVTSISASAVKTIDKTSTNKDSAITQTVVGAGRSACTFYGVTLNYPNNWKVEKPRSGNTVIRFYAPGVANVPSMFEMQAYAFKDMSPENLVTLDPRDTFESDREKLWLLVTPEMLHPAVLSRQQVWHQEVAKVRDYYLNKGEVSAYNEWKTERRNQWSKVLPVALPATIKLGPNQSVKASQSGHWIEEPMVGIRSYCQAIAFASAGCTILIGLYCPESNAQAAVTQFKQLMSEIKFTVVAPAVGAQHSHPSRKSTR
ncbi:MAG: hypothetical protein P4L53_27000 [Candidatus Obscuribacterales bacterium]|nr:hypothetical protein [Candidatus Obscuribacterales bacterium]